MYSLPPMHASPQPRAPVERSAKASSLRIVVVGDERDKVLSTVLLLRECGHLVRGVYRSAQALQAVGEFAADAVMLDIGIPDVDGYQLARALRVRYGKRCPLLIAVTAHNDETDKQRAREAGFDHHLVKPYDPIALLARLEPLAARRNRAATLSKARFGIKLVNGVLRAQLVERETEEETVTFLQALVAESQRTRCRKVLISVHESLPIFKPQQDALWPLLENIVRAPGATVALTADSPELRASQQYVERLARERGGNLRAFPCEKAAADWLENGRGAADPPIPEAGAPRPEAAAARRRLDALWQLFETVVGAPGAAVALTADSPELRASQQYVERLARERGCSLRAFPSENAAIEWLENASAAAEPPKPAAPVTQRRLRILVVDDNRDTVMTLTALLREEGHEVLSARDGHGALAGAAQWRPDAALLDIALPGGLNGWEVARRLRSASGHATRPLIIAISGKYNRQAAQKVLSDMALCNHYVAKPYDISYLLSLLLPLSSGR